MGVSRCCSGSSKRCPSSLRCCCLMSCHTDTVGLDWRWAKRTFCATSEGAASGRPMEHALEAVRSWPKRSRISGVLCYDEYGLELCSNLCCSLNLPGTRPELLRMLRDKHAFRRARADAGMCTVRHTPCTSEMVEEIASRLHQAGAVGPFHPSSSRAAAQAMRARSRSSRRPIFAPAGRASAPRWASLCPARARPALASAQD